jgi:hypothetical protein
MAVQPYVVHVGHNVYCRHFAVNFWTIHTVTLAAEATLGRSLISQHEEVVMAVREE